MSKLVDNGEPNEDDITHDARNEKNDKDINKNNKISCKEKKWLCEDEPLWRIFMKSYIEQEKKLERADKFDRRIPPTLPKFPNVKSSEDTPSLAVYPCFPLNTLNLEAQMRLPDKRNRQDKIRLWRNMKNDPAVDTSSFLPDIPPELSRTDSGKWPSTWPCVKRDLAGERRILDKLEKRKAKGLLPCQEDTDNESNADVPRDDFADHKELGHARIPLYCPSLKKTHVVDHSTGKKPGLVDGDYVVFLFGENNDVESKRLYADVCLRGMKGMRLVELNDKRVREKTWKFCFYQAVVALLAKTQLRYKFAWSVNIDYIFDHAWMLFVHMGSINVKERIRFDDIVVYNYKYSVELELVHEMKDAPRMTSVDWNYTENDFRTVHELKRPELMKTHEEIGWKKPAIDEPSAVHDITRRIEQWFDKLPEIYRNCVFRTSKFSLAFWKDGTFWYLFNPYRCNEYGFWDDDGYACIMKFSSKVSLRRHLMILMLRAYSYKLDSPLKLSAFQNDVSNESAGREEDLSNAETETDSKKSGVTDIAPESDDEKATNAFNIQIYQMIYHCVQIHNIKLLQRRPPDPRMERIRRRETDDCGFDPLTNDDDPCARNFLYENVVNEDEDDTNKAEKPSWLNNFKVTWARFASSKRRSEDDERNVVLRWHQYYVEKPFRLFSLWGEIHPTGHMFVVKNRGKQGQACYVVGAGMTRIQAPEYWSPKTLDAVVMCGDRYYTMSQLEWENVVKKSGPSDVRSGQTYLGKNFKIGETLFEVDILDDLCGRLYDKNGKNLWKIIEQLFLKQHFAILTCESYCLGIFKFCGSYYMMDVNSIGPSLFQYGDGVAYLIRATSYREFIKVLVLTIGSTECSPFVVNPIVILKMVDLGTTDLRDKIGRIALRRIVCPYEDDGKESKSTKSRDQGQRKRTIDRVSCKKSAC